MSSGTDPDMIMAPLEKKDKAKKKLTLHGSLPDASSLDESRVHDVLHDLRLLLCLLFGDTADVLDVSRDNRLVRGRVRLERLLPDTAELLEVELGALDVVAGDHC